MSQHHVVSWKLYLGIFLTLCVLTVATVGAAGQDFGVFNTPIALAIAVAKATLVVLFFMHVKYSPRLTTLVVAAGFVFLFLLILFTGSDYISRSWPITPAG
jgi:cytochrome c oxidase subunit IV